jgi:hypothetical protein
MGPEVKRVVREREVGVLRVCVCGYLSAIIYFHAVEENRVSRNEVTIRVLRLWLCQEEPDRGA